MFKAFAQFFQAVYFLFSAAEKGAKSLDALADVGLDKSVAYRDEQRIENEERIRLIKARVIDVSKQKQLEAA